MSRGRSDGQSPEGERERERVAWGGGGCGGAAVEGLAGERGRELSSVQVSRGTG